MDQSNQIPLVLCIMSTYDRRKFVAKAIEYFVQQEYHNKELVIVDNRPSRKHDAICRAAGLRQSQCEVAAQTPGYSVLVRRTS